MTAIYDDKDLVTTCPRISLPVQICQGFGEGLFTQKNPLSPPKKSEKIQENLKNPKNLRKSKKSEKNWEKLKNQKKSETQNNLKNPKKSEKI